MNISIHKREGKYHWWIFNTSTREDIIGGYPNTPMKREIPQMTFSLMIKENIIDGGSYPVKRSEI